MEEEEEDAPASNQIEAQGRRENENVIVSLLRVSPDTDAAIFQQEMEKYFLPFSPARDVSEMKAQKSFCTEARTYIPPQNLQIYGV